MSNLDDKVDKLEELTDGNTVIAIGGVKFTPAKIMIAGTILSTVLGTLYGAFEVYKDYQDMKSQIQSYVAPDLSDINKKIAVFEEEVRSTKSSVQEATNYTNEIKNDLKADIRRVEKVVETVERANKEQSRQVDTDLRNSQTEFRNFQKEVDKNIKDVKVEIEKQIKEALDNPLAN
jgi:F0F1-type ATP synthase membrane subunit b/b'